MLRHIAWIAVLSSSLAPASAAETCLRLDKILNWSVPNDKTVIAEDYQHHKFRLNLMMECSGLRFSETLAFKSVGGFSMSCLRAGDYVLSRETPSRCPIASVEPYVPATHS
jgi:hypothetical protein